LEQSVLFLDFEYIFAAAIFLILLLMFLFYVKYPYDRNIK